MCPGCVCLTIIIIIMIIIFFVILWGKSCFSAPEDGLNPWDQFEYRYDFNFRSIWLVEFALQIPIYDLSRRRDKTASGFLDYQIYQPARFIEIIPVNRRDKWTTNF